MNTAVSRRADRRPGIDAARPDLNDDFWQTCLLLLLSERAADCQELAVQLQRLGQIADLGVVDDALLALEISGLVCVVGEARSHARPGLGRTYCLTCEGAEQLSRAADELRGTHVMLGRFLARCGERLDVPSRA